MTNEWTNMKCTRIELSSKHQLWDPYDPIFESQENSMMDYLGDIQQPHSWGCSLVIQLISMAHNTQIHTVVPFDHAHIRPLTTSRSLHDGVSPLTM